jgi:hypothetical protein
VTVADEARVELNRLTNQRFGVNDEILRRAAPSQEGFGNFAPREVDSVDSNAGSVVMNNIIKPNGITKITVYKDRKSNFSPVKVPSINRSRS